MQEKLGWKRRGGGGGKKRDKEGEEERKRLFYTMLQGPTIRTTKASVRTHHYPGDGDTRQLRLAFCCFLFRKTIKRQSGLLLLLFPVFLGSVPLGRGINSNPVLCTSTHLRQEINQVHQRLEQLSTPFVDRPSSGLFMHRNKLVLALTAVHVIPSEWRVSCASVCTNPLASLQGKEK